MKVNIFTCFVDKNSHAINQLIRKTPCHISQRITQFVSFKIPDLRTSSTGVRTSEKFRPLAPQDE